jgi:type III secretion system FlhB-like substrate exporter
VQRLATYETESRLASRAALHLGHAFYTLSKQEKESMFEYLNSIKVPSSGYSSNVKRLLNMKEKKFAHVKSHDCNMLMTQLLPVALRDILPDNVRATIIKLCAFLNTISQMAIDPTSLLKL